MKARSNLQQKTASQAFRPKPLSIEQENAIDLLLSGKSDREVATLVGVHRMTVQKWRTQHPLFMATLAREREQLFSGANDRLRSMLGQALENIEGAIAAGEVRWSFELVKAVGLHGFLPPTGEMDVDKIADDIVMRELAKLRLPSMSEMLIDLDNPDKKQREQEIRDELMAEFGEDRP
jgi:tRNA A37 N6-isopentenylltransferase MiaA